MVLWFKTYGLDAKFDNQKPIYFLNQVVSMIQAILADMSRASWFWLIQLLLTKKKRNTLTINELSLTKKIQIPKIRNGLPWEK